MTGDPREARRATAEDPLVRLMVEYQGGHVEAFADLYGMLAGDLLRHFRAASREGVAQDLVQETFLEIHRSRHTYLPPHPVRAWVFGVARNVLRRHRRTAWRRQRREDAAARERAELVRRPGLEAQDVREALGIVAASRRQVWELHHVHGFSFPEISRILRIPVGAAKLRSSRAMSALRRLLGVHGGGRRE